MPCVHHCHSTVVPSPLAPPLIIASMDPQTLCPKGEEEGMRGQGEEWGRGGERGRDDGKMRRAVREGTERGNTL